MNIPREREESILDTIIVLCRRLHEANTKFIREFATLLFCNCTFIRPVRLIADQDLIDTFRSMLLDVCVPGSNIWGDMFQVTLGNSALRLTVERAFIRDIIDQENTHCSTIIGCCDCPKAFLTCSIPLYEGEHMNRAARGGTYYLEFDTFAV